MQPFTRVEGPCYIGAETQLFRANIRGAVSIGPNCRIGGEVEATSCRATPTSITRASWATPTSASGSTSGAITSNSDLRNDYGEVFVPLQGDPVPTGQAKVGCFIGDHTRTGMGSMLNTGTAIGVMCNVLPAGLLLPKHVPSFTAVLYGRVGPGFSLEQMFATARIVMGRRGKVVQRGRGDSSTAASTSRPASNAERAFQRSHDHRADFWPVAPAARS